MAPKKADKSPTKAKAAKGGVEKPAKKVKKVKDPNAPKVNRHSTPATEVARDLIARSRRGRCPLEGRQLLAIPGIVCWGFRLSI